MNILFIHEVDWLAKVVFDIHFLAEGLSLRGHRVFAIDYQDTWSRDGTFNPVKLRTKEVDGVSRAFSGASVLLRRPGFIKLPGLSRISAAFSHYREIARTIREKSIDAIVLYSVPTNGLQAIRQARKSGIPVVFRSIDILNQLVAYPLLRPLTRTLEKKVYNKVDMIIPNTPRYRQYVLDMGADESKVKLLLFPVDTELFRPAVEHTELQQKWGFTGSDPVIVFIGTLFEFSGLDGFLDQFPRLVKEVPEAKLLIVGDGPQRPRLERMVTELGLTKQVTITGFQPYPTMPQYINMATVCINTFVISDATTDFFPAKIMQYVACGKATVATALRGITSILPGESHGVVYANTAEEMTDEVISMLRSGERRKRLEQAGLDYVKSKHDHRVIAEQLETILEEVIKDKRDQARAQRA